MSTIQTTQKNIINTPEIPVLQANEVQRYQLEESIFHEFALLKTLAHKLKAVSLAAANAIEEGAKADPVSLVDVLTDYSEQLEDDLEALDLKVNSYIHPEKAEVFYR